jgi:plastocyanin
MRRVRRSGVARVGTLGVGMVLAGAVLTGCGGQPAASAPATSTAALGTVSTAADGVQALTIRTQDDYVFSPDHVTVAPGKIRLTVTNAATQLTHAFRFTPGQGPETIPAEIPLLAPGESRTIEFTVQTPGSYRFECPFHTQLGQVGTMTVSG